MWGLLHAAAYDVSSGESGETSNEGAESSGDEGSKLNSPKSSGKQSGSEVAAAIAGQTDGEFDWAGEKGNFIDSFTGRMPGLARDTWDNPRLSWQIPTCERYY
jgi:hypothetical protein